MPTSRRSPSKSPNCNGRTAGAGEHGSGGRDSTDRSRALTVATVTAVVLGLVCVAAVAPSAVAQPEPPTSYYGNVTVDGEPAEVDTEVQALIDGDVADTITVGEAGRYGGPDAFDEKLVVRNASAGDTIKFAVDGETTGRTTEWEPGNVQRIDLVIDSSSGDGADGDGDDGSNTDDGSGGSDDGTDTDDGAGGGGGNSGGASADESGDEADEPEGSSAVGEAQADVKVDSATGRATATFTDESPVESVTIDSDSLDGTVGVTELEQEPESTGPAPGTSVSVTEITVPRAVADTPGTVRTRVSRERLASIAAEPENLRVSRHADGRWRGLDTEVVEVTDETVVVEAGTPGFSYFAVSAVGDPTAEISAPDRIDAGNELTVDASDSTTEYGEIVAYEWTIGGATFTGESITLTIPESGEIPVELAAETNVGETDTAVRTVVVGAPDSGDDGSSDAGNPSNDSAPEGDLTSTADEIPGFDPLVALVALLAAALLAGRHRND